MFDLKEYFSVIGLSQDELTVSFECLCLLTQHHLKKFRYQNTYLYKQGFLPPTEREPASLDIEDVFQQLVIEDQPGYCFQNSELLRAALKSVGFNVQQHLSKTCSQSHLHFDFEDAKKITFDHEVLVVKINEHSYLVDTGFANNSLRYPLVLETGIHQVGNDFYQLSSHKNNFLLELSLPEEKWLPLYRICKEPSSFREVKLANKALFFSEDEIPIRDAFLKLAVVTENKRKCLVAPRNGPGFFKSYSEGKLRKEQIIANSEDVSSVALTKFNITLGC